jgi:alkylation response protein AidB-like acyl-CoA dehydrogenase
VHLHPEGYTVLAIVDRYAVGVEVINDWNGFGQRTTASGTVKLHNVVVDLLFFDERIIADTPNVRGAYSQLLQVAIDVGIASLDHLTQGRLGTILSQAIRSSSAVALKLRNISLNYLIKPALMVLT